MSHGRVLEGYREIPNDYPREQMTDQQKCIAFDLCFCQIQLKAVLVFLKVLQLCWHVAPVSYCDKDLLLSNHFERHVFPQMSAKQRSNSKPSSLESVRVSLLRQWLQGARCVPGGIVFTRPAVTRIMPKSRIACGSRLSACATISRRRRSARRPRVYNSSVSLAFSSNSCLAALST